MTRPKSDGEAPGKALASLPATVTGLLMPSAPALNQKPLVVFLARYQGLTRLTYYDALRTAGRILTGSAEVLPEHIDWTQLRYPHVAALLAKLSETRTPKTVNKILTPIRGVVREAWRLGLLPHEDYARLSDVTGPRIPKTNVAGRTLSNEELEKLFAATATDSSIPGRDTAIFALMLGSGLRREEVTLLDVAQYDAGARRLRNVLRKGGKRSDVVLSADAVTALDRWLAWRASTREFKTSSGQEPAFLFFNTIRRRLHKVLVNRLCTFYWKAAKIRPFTPHDLRRTFTTRLLEAGANIRAVQVMLDHESVVTTEKYDRREIETHLAEITKMPALPIGKG